MKEEIVFVKTRDDPEVKIRLAKFPALKKEFSHRTIILVPGWLNAIDVFSPMAKALQPFSNAVIYEPRGFGESISAHKKGIYSIEEYNEEFATVINSLGLKDKEFIILGSCSGASQTFTYFLDGKGPKPNILLAFHPEEYYNTPFWLSILGWIPTFLMKIIQKMIIVIYRFYHKVRGTGESPTVTWSEERLKKNDDWCLRRFVLEFIVKYDIRGRQEEINVPLQMFVAGKDHFVKPEKAKKFLIHPDSDIVQIVTSLHRVHDGNEEEIAEKINGYLSKLKI